MADEPKATAADVIATLRSIDSSLKLLVKHFGIGVQPMAATQGGVSLIAPDHDLDGKYGNEKIKFDPRDWTGEPMKGRMMNECPAPFLDMLASAHDFFAEKNAGVKTDKGGDKASYDKRTASRARGWAARIRGGYVAPAQDDAAFPSDAPLDPMDSGSVPF